MPRPKKPIDFNEELTKIDMQISKWTKTIEELRQERQKILLEKERSELEVIRKALAASGMTVPELVQLLNGQKADV